MRDNAGPLLAAAAIGAVLFLLTRPVPAPECPDGVCPTPSPSPAPAPLVPRPKKPWREETAAPVGALVANFGVGCPCCFGGVCVCGDDCRCPK